MRNPIIGGVVFIVMLISINLSEIGFAQSPVSSDQASAKPKRPAVSWFTYENIKPPYSIQYPRDFQIRKYGDEKISIGGPLITVENFSQTISIQLSPTDGDVSLPYEEWVKQQAMLLCDADGPDGGTRCDKITRFAPFTTAAGNTGYEIYMNMIDERLDPPKKTSFVVGPVFIFDISKIVKQPREALLVQIPLDRKLRTQDLETLRAIVTTLRF